MRLSYDMKPDHLSCGISEGGYEVLHEASFDVHLTERLMDLKSFDAGRPVKAILSFLLLTIILWFASLNDLSGQVVHTAVSTAGSNAAGTGGTVSFTAGQVYYLTKPGTPGNVAEGIQNCVVNCDPFFSGSTSVTIV